MAELEDNWADNQVDNRADKRADNQADNPMQKKWCIFIKSCVFLKKGGKMLFHKR